jgi:mono/diheme cytochrome c family protein
MHRPFRNLLLVAVILVPLFGFTAVAYASSSSSGPKALPGDPTVGAQLFAQNCTACHGASLEGGIGPRLNPITHLGNVKNPLDATYLIHTITYGLKGVGGYSTPMPPKGGNSSLTEQDVKDLAAFIIQQNTTGTAELDPIALAQSNIFWVTVGVFFMILVTWLLAKYNMRWIARRARERSP